MASEDPKSKPSKQDPVDVYIGHRIRMRRVQLKLSQSDVAEALGITFQQVQKFEQAQNRVTAKRLKQLALALNVPLDYFFSDLQEDELGTVKRFVARTDLPDLLNQPQSAEVLNSFFSVRSTKHRRALLELMQNLREVEAEFSGLAL